MIGGVFCANNITMKILEIGRRFDDTSWMRGDGRIKDRRDREALDREESSTREKELSTQ